MSLDPPLSTASASKHLAAQLIVFIRALGYYGFSE